MSDPKLYTVGWICAISTERVAAEAFLDEKHDGPDHTSPNDNNDYILGRIGKHNVVIAALSDGEYGTASAALVGISLLRSFPNLRIALMVGIGGGVPSKKRDIRLGDIVVSSIRKGNIGIFQYDFERSVELQKFQESNFNQPPNILRTAAGGLQAQYEGDGYTIEQSIRSAIEKKPELANYTRPDVSSDRLFRRNDVHRGTDCETECINEFNLIPRPHRGEYEDNPAIHYGRIASSNQLMKNAVLRDQLAKDTDVLCFEVEASGLAQHFPCLIIRGICDYADSHQNKEWQGYAAMTAAAYAKDILSRILPDQIEHEKPLAEVVQSHAASAEVLVERFNALSIHQDNKLVLDWLTDTDYSATYVDTAYKMDSYTCGWFFTSTTYLNWFHGDSAVLFCPGKPGSGKTVIATIVIGQVILRSQNRPEIGLAYVYFDSQRKGQQNVTDLILSMLKQLGQQQQPEVISLLQAFSKEQTHAKHKRPTLHQSLEVLRSVISTYSMVYVILDGLDECQDTDGCRSTFLSEMFKLHAELNINVLATSRPIPEIMDLSKGIRQLEISAHSQDIQTYLNNRASRLPDFVEKTNGLWHDITTGIIQASDGMFLLARLLFNRLKDKTSVEAVRTFLMELASGPASYDHIYNDSMTRIKAQPEAHRILAERTIAWLTHAKRPLHVWELQAALAVRVGDTTLITENIPEFDLMISVCDGLFALNKSNSDVRLIHSTADEYFWRTREEWFPNANLEISTTCLAYLLFDTFGSGRCGIRHLFDQRISTNYLYDYAAFHWIDHIRGCWDKVELLSRFLKSQKHVETVLECVLPRTKPSSTNQVAAVDPAGLTGSYLCAYVEFLEGVKMCAEFEDIRSPNIYGQTLLMWAVQQNFGGSVQILLDSGMVDINRKSTTGQTALSYAARVAEIPYDEVSPDQGSDYSPRNGVERRRTSSADLTRILLKDGGIDVNPKDNSGRTPFSWAVENNHLDTVKLLLETGEININDKDDWARTPLCFACKRGHVEIVKLLLNTHQVDIDSKDFTRRTPLTWAILVKGVVPVPIQLRYLKIVEMLLKTGQADPDSIDDKGRSPLSYASQMGNLDIAQRLLDTRRINIDRKDHQGRTPLSWALEYYKWDMVRLLLNTHQVDVECEDNSGSTPLLWSIEKSNLEAFKMFLPFKKTKKDSGNVDTVQEQMGALSIHDNAKISDSSQLRPFFAVSDLAKYSLNAYSQASRAKSISNKTTFKRTELSWAAEKGCENIVRYLLSTNRGNANAKDAGSGRTPLWWAARNDHIFVAQRLLNENDIDVDIKDDNGQTPLSVAAEHGRHNVVELLLDTGLVDVNSVANNFLTPLGYATVNGFGRVVEVLVNKGGANVNHQTFIKGRTALMLAAVNGHCNIINFLLQTDGVDPNFKDVLGRTPLCLAAEKGHLDAVKMLVASKKVDVNLKDNTSQTALIRASIYNHAETVRILLAESKHNGNEKDVHGRCALSWAAIQGSEAVAKVLVQSDLIDIDSKDFEGRTPLGWAALKGSESVAKLLIKSGKADVDAMDNRGETPLSYAAAKNFEGILKLLLG